MSEAVKQEERLNVRDLKPKMKLEGQVTNVELFGAFVDVGAKADGLVHISQISEDTVNRVAVKDFDEAEKEVTVGEDQLSLAIGKRGQNVRLAGKLVGWNLDIKSEVEKKAEAEAEMERMATATQELASLPEIEAGVSTLLLDAGFRTAEEVSLASLEDLTALEGIDEDTAIAIHDAAEVLLEQWAVEEAARAEAGEDEDAAGEDPETAETEADDARADDEETSSAAAAPGDEPALNEVEDAGPDSGTAVEAAAEPGAVQDDAEDVEPNEPTTEQPDEKEA